MCSEFGCLDLHYIVQLIADLLVDDQVMFYFVLACVSAKAAATPPGPKPVVVTGCLGEAFG